MKMELSCLTCSHAIREAVASDDYRLFCGSSQTKTADVAVGYVTGPEALSCPYYLKGQPREENLLLPPQPRHPLIPASSLIGFARVGN